MKKPRHPGNRNSDYPGSMLNFMYKKFRIFDWIPDIFPEIQEKFREDAAFRHGERSLAILEKLD